MPRNDDTYLTLAGRSDGLYKVKGSKHFGYAFPVTSEEDIKNCLEVIKLAHHTARHHCYAWRLGHDASRYRTNDDGEPSYWSDCAVIVSSKQARLNQDGKCDGFQASWAQL